MSCRVWALHGAGASLLAGRHLLQLLLHLGDLEREQPLRPLVLLVLHRLTLNQGAEAVPLDRRVVDEDVLTVGRPRDETVSLRVVEPLDRPDGHTASCAASYWASISTP